MNQLRKNSCSLLVFCLMLVECLLYPSEISVADHNTLLSKLKQAEKKPKKSKKKIIKFKFVDEELIDIINYLAAEKGINILLPTGANAITSKVTLNIEPLLDLDEAWDILLSILDLADYSLISEGSIYSIVKNSKAIVKEALPLFIGTAPEDLPDNDERIRYLYFLANIKASEDPQNMINAILKDVLPDLASIKVDPKTNGILITDKANNIKAAMQIIMALDQVTFRETFEVIKLRYTTADIIAKLFNENILNPEKDKNRYRVEAGKTTEASFFPKNIKIIPDRRTNTLIVLGKQQAVNQVKDFIYKYIDVELESGKSILHVYHLQYLNAASFEPVLKNIVASTIPPQVAQQSKGTAAQTGPERFFEGVLIKADTPPVKEGTSFYGGNKLIIAAKNDDWKIIRDLIEELDKPQRQVILEVLVADLTLDDIRLLGTSLRNPQGVDFPNGVAAQTDLITPQIILDQTPSTINTTTSLQSDLFANTIGSNLTNFGTQVPAGSTLISFNDANGKTWGIAQILQLFNTNKILAHPHVVAINNQQALIKIGQRRLLADEASAATAATTIRNTPQDADLIVKITPRISAGNNVNLQIDVNEANFIPGSNAANARVTRVIQTNANVKNEDILVLGGLINVNTVTAERKTPILGDIPIIGWFFKSRQDTTIRTNLTVFICPTIVEPRLRSGMSDYTRDYINLAKNYVVEAELFDSLRDPITRWFFAPKYDEETMIDDYLDKDELKKDTATFQLSEIIKRERKGGINQLGTLEQREYAKKEEEVTEDPQLETEQAQLEEIKKLLAKEKNPFVSLHQQHR